MNLVHLLDLKIEVGKVLEDFFHLTDCNCTAVVGVHVSEEVLWFQVLLNDASVELAQGLVKVTSVLALAVEYVLFATTVVGVKG